MRHRPVLLACRCHACRLDQVHELLVSGRTDAARVALEEVARVICRDQATRCTRTGSAPWPSSRPPHGPDAA
jgi:hypothetical protein